MSFQFYESRLFSAILHLMAIAQMGYALHFDFNLNIPNTAGVPQMLREGFGGRSRFITYWCLILETVYFTIAVLNDVFGSNEVAPKKKPFIRKVKDYLFAAFAFPVAFHVGIVFWSLYAYNRELIFPKVIEAFFPNWLNHIMHSNIMVFMLLELFTSFRDYPSKKLGLSGLSLFMISYLVWIHVIKFKANVWVYPILEVLSVPMRIGFFAACIVFSIIIYLVGEFANRQVWIREIKQIEKLQAAKSK